MTILTQITPDSITWATLPKRPRTLIRAAEAGQSNWCRRTNLPRLLRIPTCPKPGKALPWLLAEEATQNHARRAKTPDYNIQRHVLLMIAILAENRAMAGPSAPALKSA